MKWRNSIIMAMALVAACGSPASHLAPIGMAAVDGYRLGSGDQIRVTVYGLEALNNSYMIGDGGSISLPLIEPIAVEGKTVHEVELVIAQALADRKIVLQPSVSAQIEKYRPIYITGQVQKPGAYPFEPGLSVATAVVLAGGYTFRADSKRVEIARKTTKGLIRGSAGPDSVIMPGDTVTVYESWF